MQSGKPPLVMRLLMKLLIFNWVNLYSVQKWSENKKSYDLQHLNLEKHSKNHGDN